MKIIPETKQDIAQIIAAEFPSFGGNRPINGNPIAAALEGKKPVFAMGVDIEKVVNRVIELSKNIPLK